jgi:hypothetical protein
VEHQLSNISNSKKGFLGLNKLYANARTSDEDLIIDFEHIKWFAADMCAPFAAVYRHLSETRTVECKNITPRVRNALAANGFLGSIDGCTDVSEADESVIPYRCFNVDDEVPFAEYLMDELMARREWPNMSEVLAEAFSESILEMFVNSVQHSATPYGIFSCGQHYPTKKTLDFSIADAGVGIQHNVARLFGDRLTHSNAISWALEAGHTTKNGCGGLGLNIIREFVKRNHGRLSIISHHGYYEVSGGGEIFEELELPFPGTALCLKVRTDDLYQHDLA